MAVVNLTKDNFEETVTSNDFVVVDLPLVCTLPVVRTGFSRCPEKHWDIVRKGQHGRSLNSRAPFRSGPFYPDDLPGKVISCASWCAPGVGAGMRRGLANGHGGGT
jgi:hypothetical protein